MRSPKVAPGESIACTGEILPISHPSSPSRIVLGAGVRADCRPPDGGGKSRSQVLKYQSWRPPPIQQHTDQYGERSRPAAGSRGRTGASRRQLESFATRWRPTLCSKGLQSADATPNPQAKKKGGNKGNNNAAAGPSAADVEGESRSTHRDERELTLCAQP